MREVEYNETVSQCVRPLHRVCPGDRVRREHSEDSEESGEESSEESSEERKESSEESSEKSKESKESEESQEVNTTNSSKGPSCKYYNETVCIKKGTDTDENSQYKEECQLLEVKHK